MSTGPMVNMEHSTTRPEEVESAARNVAALFEGVTSSELQQVPRYTSEPQVMDPTPVTSPVLQEAVILPFARSEDALLAETPIWNKVNERRRRTLDGLAA